MVRALRREQDFSQREANQTLSLNQLSRAFGYPPSRVKSALANGMEPPKVRGHHFPIDQGSEAGIMEWIESQAEKRDTVTRADLRHYCQAKYSASISRGWVDSFILRRRDDLAEIKSMRQEDTRLEIPRVFLNETICCLREHIEGMKGELAFNLDEVGVFEWEGRRDKKVVIPRTRSGQTMHHRAS
jgi:hypothetical protein